MQILGDAGQEFGRPKEEMSPQTSLIRVRCIGREVAEKGQEKYQRLRNGKYLKYLIVKIKPCLGCSCVTLFFGQVYGDSQPGYSSCSNASEMPQVDKESPDYEQL